MIIGVSGSIVKNFVSLILCILVIVFFTLYRDDKDDTYFIIGIVSASILAILRIEYSSLVTGTAKLNLPLGEFLTILFFSLYTKYPKDGYYIASMVFLGLTAVALLLNIVSLKFLKSYFPSGTKYDTYKRVTTVGRDGKI